MHQAGESGVPSTIALTLDRAGDLVHALHRQLALTRDVLASNAALRDMLAAAEQRAGVQGFAQVTQRLVHTSDALQGHNQQMAEVIQTTAAALDAFAASMAEFETRFADLGRYIHSTRKSTGAIVQLALQSKMLSLNARIEAARIGDAGAGFNVVAGEMGTLAQRTEALSNEITENLGGMMSALVATSEEFTRNKSAFDVAGGTIQQLRDSTVRLHEETASVVAASTDMEQIAFNQVELQEYLEGVGRHAGWIDEAAGSLLVDLEASQAPLETAWRAQLPPELLDRPQSLDEFEQRLYAAVVHDDASAAEAAVIRALEAGLAPGALLDRLGGAAMRVSLEQMGQALPTEVYFRNGDVLQTALAQLEPALEDAESGAYRGVVVLGNAFEDYHDLGRRLVGIALRAAGFQVVDLGLSVSNERFVEAVREHDAQVVGVSSLLLHTAKWIPRLREDLRHAQLSHVAIIAGGAPFLVDPHLRDRFHVDGVGRTPSDAVRLVRALVAERHWGASQ